MSQNARKILGTAALVVLLLVVGVLASQSPMARFSNLARPEVSFPDVYVQMKVGSDEKCLVSGRAGTTVKRSESSVARTRWDCRFVEHSGGATTVIAIDKNRPSWLFVPFTEVEDLAFPIVYGAVRETLERPMPRVRWVHFFFNRQLRGLYLEVQLPGRRFASDHELGRLELLTASGDEMVCFDWKMRAICRVYEAMVADAIFPAPATDQGLRFLSGLAPSASRSFILSELDLETLVPYPLPVAVDRLIPSGRDPYHDERFRRWQGAAPVTAETEARYAEAVRDSEPPVATFLDDLRRSIEVSCSVLPCDPEPYLARLENEPTRLWLARHGLDGSGDGAEADGGGG